MALEAHVTLIGLPRTAFHVDNRVIAVGAYAAAVTPHTYGLGSYRIVARSAGVELVRDNFGVAGGGPPGLGVARGPSARIRFNVLVAGNAKFLVIVATRALAVLDEFIQIVGIHVVRLVVGLCGVVGRVASVAVGLFVAHVTTLDVAFGKSGVLIGPGVVVRRRLGSTGRGSLVRRYDRHDGDECYAEAHNRED